MRRFWLCKQAMAWLIVVAAISGLHADETVRSRQVDRSPVDVVVSPDGKRLVSVNQTSNSLSLVDLQTSKVLDEIVIDAHPLTAIANRAGDRVYVSCRDAGTVVVLRWEEKGLVIDRRIATGFHPFGMALDPDEKRLYVALSASDEVAVVDLSSGSMTAKVRCGRWPRHVALSPDGKRLAVSASGDRGLGVIDCERQELLFQETFAGLNIGHLAISADGRQVYFPWMVYRANPVTAGNIRLGWVLASRIGRLKLEAASRREAFSLDPPGKAIADVHGLALSRDDKRLVVSASGTQELLVYQVQGLPFKDYGGTDHIDPQLLEDRERFTRIPLGGRPMGLRIAPDNDTVYVANYLDNRVQVVSLASCKMVQEIELGSAPERTLARRGEAIFYDAKRSLDQWYSCHTCHYEGGINSERMDTTNDGTRNTFKTVLPLYHFDKTGPWTWHGWQTDARAAMRKSVTETMLGPAPDGGEIDALLAYLRDLQPPPNPFRQADGSLTEAAARGKQVFESAQANCSSCHSGPYFTDGQIHDVGLGSQEDAYRGFNTPTLIGVYQRAKLLHDGRAKSLDEVLTGPHDPAKVSGAEKLSDEQRSDLIAYLKSL